MLATSLLQLLVLATASMAASQRHALEIQLVHQNDTTISAIFRNTDRVGYNVLHRNTILDPDSTPGKLHVKAKDTTGAPFRGIHKHDCAQDHLPEGAFTHIAAGETLHRDVDIADLFDLEEDVYSVSSHGLLPYAAGHSTELQSDALLVKSNALSLPVTSKRPSISISSWLDHRRHHAKRTTIQADCSNEQKQEIMDANEDCARLATAAADAITSGSADDLFQQYFKSTSDSTRSTVSDIYTRVARECTSTPGGTSTSHCTDQYNYCSGSLLAYTLWQGSGTNTQGTTYYCPRYFDGSILQATSGQCHAQSRATNTLHEMTHAVAATRDVAYGFDGISRLGSEEAVVNADTYALFATDLDLGCGGGLSGGSGTASSSNSGGSSGTGARPSAASQSSSTSWNDWLSSFGLS